MKFNFKKAHLDPAEYEIVIQDLCQKWDAGHELVRKCYAVTEPEVAHHAIRTHILKMHEGAEVYLSDKFQVEVRRTGDDRGVWLSIKRRDKLPIRDWRDLQGIKNALVGRECEAVELFPAESRLVDSANQYHLWAINDPSYRFPFGFNDRLVSEDVIGKSVQRPFEK